MYEFTGMVSEVCEVQTFPSGFTKRELVVREERGEWPRNITFNFKKDDIAKLEGVSAGDRVTVEFILDGREWTDTRSNKVRHFSDLVGVAVKVLSSSKSGVVGITSNASCGEDSGMPF